jgi:hypothetical protein
LAATLKTNFFTKIKTKENRMENIYFETIKIGKEVIGFGVAAASNEAKAFCRAFPKALKVGEAKISFSTHNKITLSAASTKVEFELSAEDAIALKTFIFDKNRVEVKEKSLDKEKFFIKNGSRLLAPSFKLLKK